MLTGALADSTADAYGRQWAAFEEFCADNGWPSLPTTAAAVACYVGTLCERQLAQSTIDSYLSPVNGRHVAAGFPKPATGRLVQDLRAGYARMVADRSNSFPFARAPLPAPVAWRIAELASRTPDAAWRARFTAVVLAFVLARRTSEVLELQLQDVETTADGGIRCSVSRCKGGERRNTVTRLVFDLPASPCTSVPDLPLLLFSALVSSLRASGAPPSRLLFSTVDLDRVPGPADLTAWLHVALDRLGEAVPAGVLYSSYSCRGGGATAMDVCGLAPPAIARLLGHAGNDPKTANAHYIDALAPVTLEAFWLVGRYSRVAPPFVARLSSSPGQPAASGAA